MASGNQTPGRSFLHTLSGRDFVGLCQQLRKKATRGTDAAKLADRMSALRVAPASLPAGCKASQPRLLHPFLKQQRRKLREIPPPHRPTMVAFGFTEVVADAVLLQHSDKLAAVLHQAILFATGDPEQFEFLIRRLRIRQRFADRIFRVANEGAESAHPTEQFEVVQADSERLAAAH